MVAIGTSGDDVGPGMGTPQMFGLDVVDGQIPRLTSTILAGVIIAPKDLPACHFHAGARFMHHLLQANNGWFGKGITDGVDDAAAVLNQRCLIQDHQADSAAHIAHVDWFVVRVENKNVFHGDFTGL